VVVHPHDADDDEAQAEAEERGPLVQQGAPELTALIDVRYADFEDQQRNRDGENAVAKRLQAPGLVVVALVVNGGVAS
jgi:hypothetical protein